MSFEEGTKFDPSKLSKVVVHGWGGGLHLGKFKVNWVMFDQPLGWQKVFFHFKSFRQDRSTPFCLDLLRCNSNSLEQQCSSSINVKVQSI